MNATPDYDEYEVDVPATEYFYDVTCNTSGLLFPPISLHENAG